METPLVATDHTRKLLEAYAMAVGAKNVAGFVDLYAPDVHVYDAWARFEYDGAESWRNMVQDWFDELGEETVGVQFDAVRVHAGDQVMVVSAAATYTAFSANHEKLRSLVNRMTMVLELHGSEWLIVHEHSSLPLDMNTGQGIFDS